LAGPASSAAWLIFVSAERLIFRTHQIGRPADDSRADGV
jgi:hypothetical protein